MEANYYELTFTKPYSGKVYYSFYNEDNKQTVLHSRKLYDFFNKDPEQYFAEQCDLLTKGQPLHKQEIGWFIEKDIRKHEDITWVGLFWKTGPKVNIVRKEMKEAVESAKLTGVRFFPIWVGEINKDRDPDYWGMVTSNPLMYRHISQGVLGYQKEKYFAPMNIKDKLNDFNCLMQDPDGVRGSFVLPRIISQNAYEVYKNFKGVTFRPVEFV